MTSTSFGDSVQSTAAAPIASGDSNLGTPATSMTTIPTTEYSYWKTTYNTNQKVRGFGIAIHAQYALPDPTSYASATSGSAHASAPGLSAGAAAGIAIGGLIAVILVGLGMWLLYRRGVSKGRDGDGKMDPAAQKGHPEEQQTGQDPAQGRPDEFIPQRSPVEVHETDFRRHELYEREQRSPTELHADTDFDLHFLIPR